jgi:5-methylcytosine-specific restriction endonuclease McrA
MKAKRKNIGKRLRFSIFSRDNFSCRYCGRQSDQVPLVLEREEAA